jgi:hypothetical protein
VKVQAGPKPLKKRPAVGLKRPLIPAKKPPAPKGRPPAPRKLPKPLPKLKAAKKPVPALKGLKRPLAKTRPAKKPPIALKRPGLKKRPPLGDRDTTTGDGKTKAPALRPPPAKKPNAPAFIRENAAKARVEPLGVQRPAGSSKRPLLARFLPRPIGPRMRLRRLLGFFVREPRRRKGFRAKNQRPLLGREVAKTAKQGRRALRTVSEIFNDVLTHKISRAMASDDVPEAAPLPDFALEHYPGATGGSTSAASPTQSGAAGGTAGPRSGGFLAGLLGALKAGLSFASKRFAGTGFGSFAADSLHMITQGEGLAHAIEQAYGAFKGGGIKALVPKLSSVGEQAVSLKNAADPVLRMIGFRMSPQTGAPQVGDPRFEGAAEANERAVLRMLTRGQPAAAGQATRGGTAAPGMVHRDARLGAPRIAGPVLVPAAGGGEQLSGPARAYVEGFFGRSFGDVRIHRGPSAVSAADKLSAHAFTAGRDIYFGRGEFRPETPKGMALLVHELTHVTQQGPSVQRKATAGGESVAAHEAAHVVQQGGGGTFMSRMVAGMEAIAGPLMARLGGELAQAGINSASALIRAIMPRPPGVTTGDIDPNVGGGKVDRVPESDPIIRTQVEQGLAARAVALPGMPLPADLRDKLEEEIDVDLSRVRLHTGRVATDVVEALGADAFAKGESVVLGEKAKADLSSGKLGTLAHELAHVRQHQRREHLGSRSPLAREALEDTAKEVERRMPTFSRVAGVGEFLLSEKMLQKVEEGLPEELELLRPRKRPQPTIEPEPKQDDDGEMPDDGSNIIHQLMWYYGVRPQVGEEEFIDELTERVQDLMEEELKIERERKHVEAPF